MTIKDYIAQNPYRILGVYMGDSAKVELQHLSRIKAFDAVGQHATFSLRGDDRLKEANRITQTANSALQILSLPQDRIRFALTWYADSNEQWAELLNNAVDCLLSDKPQRALEYYEKLICNYDTRKALIDSATHGRVNYSEGEVLDILQSVLQELDCNWFNNIEFNTSPNILSQLWDKCSDFDIHESFCIFSYLVANNDVDGMLESYEQCLTEFSNNMQKARNLLGGDNPIYQRLVIDAASAIYTKSREVADAMFNWIFDTVNFELDDSGNAIKVPGSSHRREIQICCRNLIFKLVNDTNMAISNINPSSHDAIFYNAEKILFEGNIMNRGNILDKEINSTSKHLSWGTWAWIAFLVWGFYMLW